MRLSVWPAAALAVAGLALTTVVGGGQLRGWQADQRATVGAADRSAPDRSAADRSDDITGSIGAAPAGNYLPLSDEQRGQIFDGIMELRDAPVASVPPTATALPGSVALQDLPASVTNDVPMVQGYKFVKLNDRILLVRPADRLVVAVMPRYKTVLE
jgi:hypothetical protein